MICQYKQCKRGLLSFRVAKVLILYGTAKLIWKKSPPQKIESLRLVSDQRLPFFRRTLTQVQLSCFYIYSVPLQISSFFPCVFPCPLLVFPASPSLVRIATGKTGKTALRYIIFAPTNSQRQEWWWNLWGENG